MKRSSAKRVRAAVEYQRASLILNTTLPDVEEEIRNPIKSRKKNAVVKSTNTSKESSRKRSKKSLNAVDDPVESANKCKKSTVKQLWMLLKLQVSPRSIIKTRRYKEQLQMQNLQKIPRRLLPGEILAFRYDSDIIDGCNMFIKYNYTCSYLIY